MNAPDRLALPDIQSVADSRNVYINRVGVKGLLHPLQIASAGGAAVATVASVDMAVGLPPHLKGTHMSRFVEILQGARDPIGYHCLNSLLRGMVERLDAVSGVIEMRFPYFIAKRAPVSQVESLLDYQVMLRGEVSGDAYSHTLQVQAPVTSLCPCSKEISEYGAHNQRSHITIRADLAAPLAIEELARIAEDEASCELFGLLKRPDEKFVTERAYDNPKFVEDLVRDIAMRLDRDERILAYTLESENFESIHNHSAYAVIERNKPGIRG